MLRLVFLAIMVVCLFQLGRARLLLAVHEKQKQELILARESMRTQGKTEDQEVTEEAEAGTEAYPGILQEYRGLSEKNPDIVGWLSVEGTKIDYPVMQCSDNEYYLSHDFYGKESKYGCLFVKDIADVSEGTNFVIYGHNMKDGSMFGSLEAYKEREFCETYPEIAFDTLYETRTYEIMAVFPSQVYQQDEAVFKYYQFYEARSEAEFEDFYSNVMEQSLYDTGVTAQYGDHFLTLSTCSDGKDKRMVVVAKLKDRCSPSRTPQHAS